MTAAASMASIEEQIDQWRSYVRRRQIIQPGDVAELEDHLREQIASLAGAGLAEDEAFLIAVKRIGDLDVVSREFAREHSDRLWKQLVAVPADTESAARAATDAVLAFALAGAAAVAIKVPALFGVQIGSAPGFYARNLALFVFPLLTGYFAWKRGVAAGTLRWLVVTFLAALVFANAYPFAANRNTEILTALHLPIALWLVVGIAYTGKRWSTTAGRMDFVRFSGELFIYYVLIALGGAVLTAFMAMIFQAVGLNAEPFFQSWLLPCGAVGAVMVAARLVEAKQSVIENMAPVLAWLFTPLFAVVLVVFLGTVVWTGHGIDIERNALIAFDLLLGLVLGLLLYSISARNPRAAPGIADVLQAALVVSALLADTVALWAIASRIDGFGITPNRAAGLGANIILLVNLAWSAVLQIGFLRRRCSFAEVERWQTDYLPVYAAWAAVVVVAFPPLFRFV